MPDPVTDYAALLAAGTPTPWEVGRIPNFEHVVYSNDDGSVTGVCRCDNNPRHSLTGGCTYPPDAALIVAAINGLVSGDLVPRADVYDCRETPDECGGIPYAQGVADGILIEREREDVGALVKAAKGLLPGNCPRACAICSQRKRGCVYLPLRHVIARIEARHEG